MFRLPFLFIATGLVCFVLFDLSTLTQAAGWIVDAPRRPAGWFHAHLLVLGWGTMIAMGAVYQLIIVILQKELFSRPLGYAHYALFAIGTIGLLTDFAALQVEWIAVFAVLAWIGIMLFAVNVALTLVRATVWNPITISAACAVLYLVLTGLAGLMMGLDFGFNLWPAWHERLLYTHIWLGAVGWFGLLITGFSYKLLPMFYLAHGVSDRTAYAALALWNAAVLVGAVVFLCGAPHLAVCAAVALLTAAVHVYNLHMTRVRKARHKKSPGAGIAAALYSARALAVVCTAALVCAIVAPQWAMSEPAVVVAGWAYLWGWVALTILGYLSKIVPFLWWTHKYGPRVGKGPIPTMADLLEDRYAAYSLTAIAVCLVALVVGLAFGGSVLAVWAGAALALCSLVYILLVGRVFVR
jgi:hypothetical protein